MNCTILTLLRRSGPIVVIVGAFAVLPLLLHKLFQPKLPVAMPELHQVPRHLAEIEFQDETGKKYTLGQFHGNFILVNIWATWCPPCKEEMPSLNSLASHFSAKDLKIVPISVDLSGVPTVRHFYTEFGLDKLSIYVDPSTNVMHAFSVVGIPTTVLINRDGLEIGRRVGPAQWDSAEIIEGLARIIGSDVKVTRVSRKLIGLAKSKDIDAASEELEKVPALLQSALARATNAPQQTAHTQSTPTAAVLQNPINFFMVPLLPARPRILEPTGRSVVTLHACSHRTGRRFSKGTPWTSAQTLEPWPPFSSPFKRPKRRSSSA